MNQKQAMSRIIKACKGTRLEDSHKVVKREIKEYKGVGCVETYKIYVADCILDYSWTKDHYTLQEAFDEMMKAIEREPKI